MMHRSGSAAGGMFKIYCRGSCPLHSRQLKELNIGKVLGRRNNIFICLLAMVQLKNWHKNSLQFYLKSG